jgi:hypothetical protein
MNKKDGINTIRKLSSIFTGRELYNFLIKDKSQSFYDIINEYRKKEKINTSSTYYKLIKNLYNKIYPHYRNEYFFKNLIANQIFLRESNLFETSYLSEFPIGNSIADIVIVNKSSKVFEIKTELDSPTRLKSQLDDYRKTFEQIYLVTHENLKEKYCRLLPDDIGLYTINENLDVRLEKYATLNSSLEFDTMFSFLRLSEMENIILQVYESLPKVRQVQKYKAYRILLRYLPIDEFNIYWKSEISKRTNSQIKKTLRKGSIPIELTHWSLTKIKSQKDLAILKSKFSKPIIKNQNTCISHF